MPEEILFIFDAEGVIPQCPDPQEGCVITLYTLVMEFTDPYSSGVEKDDLLAVISLVEALLVQYEVQTGCTDLHFHDLKIGCTVVYFCFKELSNQVIDKILESTKKVISARARTRSSPLERKKASIRSNFAQEISYYWCKVSYTSPKFYEITMFNHFAGETWVLYGCNVVCKRFEETHRKHGQIEARVGGSTKKWIRTFEESDRDYGKCQVFQALRCPTETEKMPLARITFYPPHQRKGETMTFSPCRRKLTRNFEEPHVLYGSIMECVLAPYDCREIMVDGYVVNKMRFVKGHPSHGQIIHFHNGKEDHIVYEGDALLKEEERRAANAADLLRQLEEEKIKPEKSSKGKKKKGKQKMAMPKVESSTASLSTASLSTVSLSTASSSTFSVPLCAELSYEPDRAPDTTRQSECCVCLSRPPICAFFPCGHRCVCEECSHILMEATNNCPICKNNGIAIKIYDS